MQGRFFLYIRDEMVKKLEDEKNNMPLAEFSQTEKILSLGQIKLRLALVKC